MVVIIDYSLGNLRSVEKAFDRIKVNAVISNDEDVIMHADRLVLPGVGNFKKGMEMLYHYNLVEILTYAVQEKKIPVLGICLGMQLMTEYGEEGDCAGLKWIKGNTIRLDLGEDKTNVKIPHIGWNDLEINKENKLINSNMAQHRFYFVHSYVVNCEEKDDEIASTVYGTRFTSAFQKENISGVQFHPEKSYKQGLELLKNFTESY
jgi:glutamine amidotransferase